MSVRRRIVLLLVAFLVLLPTGLLMLVASTEWGLSTVATRLAVIGPVTLHVEGVSGTLARGAHIDTLDIRHRRVHLHFTGIDGRLRLAPLLWQTISVPHLKVETMLIEVPRVSDLKEPWKPHFLPPLMRIHADSVHVAVGALVIPNGLRFDATHIEASGAVYPNQVRIHSGTFDMPTLHVTTDGRVFATEPISYSGQASANWQMPGQPLWTATASFEGTTETLPLNAAITAPFHAGISGRFLDMPTNWRFEGQAKVQDFDIVPFGGGPLLGKLSGALSLGADHDGFRAKGIADSSGLNAGSFDVDFDGFYSRRRLTIRSASATHKASNARISTTGTVDVMKDSRPMLTLAGDWRDFRWPLRGGAPIVRSNKGRYTLEGDRPYRIVADGDFTAADMAPMTGTAVALLDASHVSVTRGSIAAFGGHADLSGDVAWAPSQSWRVTGTANDIDFHQLRPDVPGRIGFDFIAAGRRFASNGDIDLSIDGLHGTLRGGAASGSGRISRRGDDFRFSGVDLHIGKARLTLDGVYGPQRDLHFGLNTDDLSLLSADARGRIAARGSLSGTEKAPVLGIRAQGSSFVFGETSLRSFDADVDMDLRDGGSTTGRMRLRELRFRGRLVDTAEVQIEGRTGDNSAFAVLNASGLQVSLGAHGAFRDGRWQGTIRELDAGDGGVLRLSIESQAPLAFSAEDFRLGPLCLKGRSERFCAAADGQMGVWRAKFDAEQLPLRMLIAGLSQADEYDGTIGADVEVHGAPREPVTGRLHASLVDAQLRHHLPKGREERFTLGTGAVDATATRDDFAVRVSLDAGAAGNLKGHLDGRRNGTDWRENVVSGEFSLETVGLNLLDVYVSGIDRAAGRLAAHATVNGTLGAPELNGDVQVRNGELDLYAVNLALRETSLDASLDINGLRFTGSTKAGDGTGRVSGQLAWRDRKPFGTMHVEGENLRLVNVPEARILASPKLEFTISDNRVDVSGEVKVPQATLEPVTITNAVLSSGDEVIVGQQASQRQSPWLVSSDIAITLGDRVSIDSYGLKGRVTGSIRTRVDEQQISRGSGELSVTDGKYAAFGRILDIARGRLIFNNGPMNDPGIDLRAQKVFPDVTAGVNVRGTLRAPRMTFFSEPAIPQSQIVSLILAGGSLDSVQSAARTGTARNEALAQGGAIIAQQIGSRVGIEDVGIESDTTNETSLVLGKYLSPRLYVSYGISLAEAINTVKLRYTIGDRWTVKTESGRARSADLVYTIRK
jgi:translocation and assembly module TamB